MNKMLKQHENSLALNDAELIKVLQASLYPGAMDDSVKMVISYCRQAGLDPMQKPIHIVPMSVKNAQTGQYEFRDVVMPGIGLYRIQADRSGSCAGMSKPIFGPEITQDFTDKNGKTVSVSFPEYCEMTASKIVGDRVVEFTSIEYWIENYATDSRKSSAPNSMWRKRPRGQIAKCTEAQTLRKGWPEIGAAPIAEEMEGKEIDITSASGPAEHVVEQMPEYPAEKFEKNFETWENMIHAGKKTASQIIDTVSSIGQLTEAQINKISGCKVGNGDAG